jgi:hypothetical protein
VIEFCYSCLCQCDGAFSAKFSASSSCHKNLTPQVLPLSVLHVSVTNVDVIRVRSRGTILQAGKSQVRFPMRSLDFQLAQSFQPHYSSGVRSAFNRNEY